MKLYCPIEFDHNGLDSGLTLLKIHHAARESLWHLQDLRIAHVHGDAKTITTTAHISRQNAPVTKSYRYIDSAVTVPPLVICDKECKSNHKGDERDKPKHGASPCTEHHCLSVEVLVHDSLLNLYNLENKLTILVFVIDA